MGLGELFPGPAQGCLLSAALIADRFSPPRNDLGDWFLGTLCRGWIVDCFYVNELARYVEWAVLTFIKHFSQVESDDAQVSQD